MKIFDGKYEFTASLKRALSEIDPDWRRYPGLIVPGTHTPTLVEEKIEAIGQARKSKTPALLICFGHQLAAIEWARANGVPDATSEELGEGGTFVVKKIDKLKVGGYFKDGDRWNNFEVVIDWEKPDFFFTTQSHPEYESYLGNPNSLLVEFLEQCRNLHQAH